MPVYDVHTLGYTDLTPGILHVVIFPTGDESPIEDSTEIGSIDWDADDLTRVLFHDVRDLLYKAGIQNMGSVVLHDHRGLPVRVTSLFLNETTITVEAESVGPAPIDAQPWGATDWSGVTVVSSDEDIVTTSLTYGLQYIHAHAEGTTTVTYTVGTNTYVLTVVVTAE